LTLTKHRLFINNINLCQYFIYLLRKLDRLESQLAAKRQVAQQQYELQNNYLISTASLADNPAVHSFFTDLLTTYAEKFARNKELDISELPSLKFVGFYYELGNGEE
jgi:hypothetical protein